jgi:hypothetical protein
VANDGQPIVDEETGQPAVGQVPFVRVKASSELSRTQLAAVVSAEETVSRTGGKAISVKMGDKRAALKHLGSHLGLFAPKPGAVPGVDPHPLIARSAAAFDQTMESLLARAEEAADSEVERLAAGTATQDDGTVD